MASNITAQSLIAEISRDHLECPICNERFKQPKLLECSHSFCIECLQQLKEKVQSSAKLPCPVCRQETLLTKNGIDGLKTDFKTLSLIKAFEKQETQLNQLPGQEFASKCSKHTDKDLIMFCNKCKKLICTSCIVRDHRFHSLMEINEALDKCKQHATELVAKYRQSIKSFIIAIQEIDISRNTLDSMFAETREKISKKADEEIAKEVARIREEQQKLMQEAEQIYKDRVKTMETARATNSKEMNKAELKQDEVDQHMDQQINIVHHIEQLLQDLKECREMKSTQVPDGLTCMDFKEGQKTLGRLVLKDKWTLTTEMKTNFYPCDVSAYSNSDIVVSHGKSVSLTTISVEKNPQATVIPLELPIKGLTRPSTVTVNKNDELIVLDNETVKIFNKHYQLIQWFNPGRWPDSEPSCIAVDANNLIAVGYRKETEISLHKQDGSLIRRLPAPGVGGSLTTYKQRLIYTNWADSKLVSVDYNGEVVFSVGINQPRWPRGVCCNKNGSIYVAVRRGIMFDILRYSPQGRYNGCIIKDCAVAYGFTVTPASDLVLATTKSVQVYQHEC